MIDWSWPSDVPYPMVLGSNADDPSGVYEDWPVPVKPSCCRYSVSAASTYCGGGVGTPVPPKTSAVPSPSGESALSASAVTELNIGVNPHRPTTNRPTLTR